MKIYIYYLHKGDNIPFYIGKTINLKSRLTEHKIKRNNNLIELNVIEEVNKNGWKFWECYWIEQFISWGFTLENKNKGGGGPSKVTEKVKKIISQANKGRKHSVEGRLSRSKKLIGRKLSKKTREKISKNKTGIRFENGYNMKIVTKPGVSETHKGRISPNKGKGKPINLFNIEGKYLSMHNNTVELGKHLDINPETIRQCLIGKQKTICNKQYYVKYTI